ncbi:sugar phosphate nucleotidyltransferase [Sporomusa acidovorans]|uniref:Nucleotidyl transferase domain-containing protein n=1 Tax=Sporomusa acidovorans (strain ATCC 49682 / DSM 3132 / Mol) TaxID=1123286 RepID=A0ABZ3J7Y0_SPOA4|nr:sugar phosphate nucleotidyltransferase [Sporomusa acidovorans]OZC19325.1 bifunctional IPC transferase and DIPP synthase [Sporomusa acidovorans DSM 3132]SDD80758.1 Choline kinase [Sporomusa acidovorans]
MKLFILAAGKGTRLWPLTKNTPKSLIDLGDGTTILERQITTAIESNLFNEIIIITGYKAEQIDAKVVEYGKNIKITTLYNPFFDSSNNLVSLWLAQFRMLEDDFIITNGDNIYKENVLTKIVADEEEIIQVTVDFKDSYDEDDMKVKLDGSGNIVRIHKDIALAETGAESVGLALVKGARQRRIYVNKLCQLVKKEEYINKFWLETFNSLIEDGITIKKTAIEQQDWKEVDFHPDMESLKKLILSGF